MVTIGRKNNMSETVSGTVEVINKNKGGYWAFVVADTWFGVGKNEPTAFKKGDTVQFSYNSRGKFKDVVGEVEVLEQGAGTVRSYAEGSTQPTCTSSKATNWDLKDKRITYLACRKDAIAIIQAMVDTTSLPLPTKKDERYEAILALVDELTSGFYSKVYSSPFEVE